MGHQNDPAGVPVDSGFKILPTRVGAGDPAVLVEQQPVQVDRCEILILPPGAPDMVRGLVGEKRSHKLHADGDPARQKEKSHHGGDDRFGHEIEQPRPDDPR
jgi:hypothetical protein